MSDYKAIIVGATGLIGSELTDLLLADQRFREVTVLVRKWNGASHPKLQVATVNFENPSEIKSALGTGDFIFCCIGTTRSKVKGNLEMYRKIDIGIPHTVARAALENGYKKFILVSAVGANINSSNYYLNIKGEVEKIIQSLPFIATHIFRPSFLTGNREENRPVEKVMMPVMKIFSPLFVGSLSKYKAIASSAVAKAMIESATSLETGNHIYHYNEIKALLK